MSQVLVQVPLPIRVSVTLECKVLNVHFQEEQSEGHSTDIQEELSEVKELILDLWHCQVTSGDLMSKLKVRTN